MLFKVNISVQCPIFFLPVVCCCPKMVCIESLLAAFASDRVIQCSLQGVYLTNFIGFKLLMDLVGQEDVPLFSALNLCSSGTY